MVKIELQPEQIKDVIEKYKSNYKVEDLCNIYNVGRKIIYKYTKGIKRYYQDENWLKQKYYVERLNKRQIAKLCNVNEMCIHENMKKLGIETIDSIGRKRKYDYLCPQYFHILTKESSYWLGFIMADGCIRYTKTKYNTSEKYLQILLARKDEAHLVNFLSDIKCNVPIVQGKTELNGKIYLNSSLRIRNVSIVECLIDLGITPSNKSNHEIIPKILTKNGITISSFDSVTKCVTLETISHHEYIKDFIRGLFDGDGCISPYYSDNILHCSWSIVSSLEVCNYIKDLFKELFDINMTVLPDTGIYRIETSTDSSILNIMEWLYEDENCRCLQRKKDIYIQWKTLRFKS